MDFSLMDFVKNLRDRMYSRFPNLEKYESSWGVMQTNAQKHPNRPEHIKDVAFKNNPTMVISDNMIVFEIGNEYAEKLYPYYHILEDSPVIRKRGKADKYTKGSQDNVKDLSKRDYGIISFNGKVYTKEYQKNVRGIRKKVIENANSEKSKNYVNKQYRYLEKMADEINPFLAQDYSMEYVGIKREGLKVDFEEQDRDYSLVSKILEM